MRAGNRRHLYWLYSRLLPIYTHRRCFVEYLLKSGASLCAVVGETPACEHS